MIQVIRIPMGSDPAPFFANLFLAHKEADWVKAQCKLGTINVRKINNSFWFIDDLLSLNVGSAFEKHYKDIYPTELELKKENNSTSCVSFLDLYGYIENGQMRRIKFSLIKMIQQHQEVFIKCNKSIEEVMQAIGF